MLKRARTLLASWGEFVLAVAFVAGVWGASVWAAPTIETLYDISYGTTAGTRDFPGITLTATTAGDVTATSYYINIPSGSTLEFVNDTTSIDRWGDLKDSISAITWRSTSDLQVTFNNPATADGQFVTLFGVKVTSSGTASTATSFFVSSTPGGAATSTASKKAAVHAASLSSASASRLDGSTTAFPLPDVTVNALAGSTITSGNDIRIQIPSAASLAWDTGAVVTISGDATGKVGTVSYTGGGTILVLDVTSDFSSGDDVTLSGLKFSDQQGASGPIDWLELILNGATAVAGFDIRPFYTDSLIITYDGSTIGTTTTGGTTSFGGVTIRTGTNTLTTSSTTGDLYLFLPIRDEPRFNKSGAWSGFAVSVNGTALTPTPSATVVDDGTANTGLGRVLWIDLTSDIGTGATVSISGMQVENTGGSLTTAHIGVGINGPNQVDAAHSNAQSSSGSGVTVQGNPSGDCFIASGSRGRDGLILLTLVLGGVGAALLGYLLRRARG